MYHCFRIDGYRDIYDANTMVEGGGDGRWETN